MNYSPFVITRQAFVNNSTILPSSKSQARSGTTLMTGKVRKSLLTAWRTTNIRESKIEETTFTTTHPPNQRIAPPGPLRPAQSSIVRTALPGTCPENDTGLPPAQTPRSFAHRHLPTSILVLRPARRRCISPAGHRWRYSAR